MNNNYKEWIPSSDENGNQYYYNQFTGESSWKLPVSNSNINGDATGDYYQDSSALKSGGFGGTWYNNDNSGNSSGGQPTSRSNDVLDGSGRNSNSFHMQPPSVDTEEYQYKSVNVAADADAKLRNRSERSNTISSGAFGGGKNSINELLESDKDRQLRKIDNLKNLSGSKVLREEGRWQEWEAGNGATFYVCLVPDSVTGDLKQPFGGQWDKPRVFEVADDPSKRTLSSAVTPGNDRKIVEVLNRRQHEISSLSIKAEGWANSCGPGHDYSSIGGGKDNPLNAYRSMKAFVPVLTPNRARVTENIDEFQYDYEEGKEEGTAVNIASELPVTLKDYYQEFDNTVLCGTTFADQSIYHPGSDSGTGANASPSKSKNRKRFSGSKGLTRANSYSDANVLAMYSPVPSLSPLKSHNITVNQTLNFNQNQSAIESPDKNARHPSDGDPSAEHSKLQSDFALDRESGLNHAEVSSFYYSDNHENPFNKSGMTGIDDGLSPKKKSATINAKTISTAADRYKLAYQSLKEKDILNVNNLEVSTLNRDAAGAQKRWKEFIHKTSHNIYAGTKYEQEMEEFGNDPKHHYSATASFRNDDKDEWDRLPIEDNVDEYLSNRVVDAHNADNKDKTNADFNLLYSRAIIVQQVWPWTCLVDMKTSKCFYRNELEDYFQFDPPSEFLLNEDGTIFVDSNNPNSSGTGTRDPEEEDEDMRAAVRATPEIFDLLKGVGEGNDGTQNVFQKKRLKQQKDHENNLFSIPTTDNAVLLVQRFKDELQKRRQLLEQKRQKQLVLDVNMTRSRMRTVGGITSASSRVPIRRAKNVGESNTDAGVARRVRAGINKNNESGALSQEYVFGGDYKAFIDDYLDENNRSKNCVDLEEQNRIIRELKKSAKAKKQENTAWKEGLVFLDRLRRLPNPYLYDFLFHGKGDAETAVAVGLEGEQGQELDESGNCVELNNTTFDTAVHCSFNASTEGMQNIANDTRADKTTGVPNAKKKKPPDHTHLFKYRGKNSTSVSPLIVADHTHEYGAARRLLKKKQQQEEKLLVAKNIMINNTKKQLGEFRSLVTLLHREFDAQVGDENNTTGVVENEILKSHLLEGIISHRGIMKRPRAKPPLAMAASAGQNEGVTSGAPPVAGGLRDGMGSFVDGLPNYLCYPNALSETELQDALSSSLSTNKPRSSGDGVSSAPMYDVVDYGKWLKYIIFSKTASTTNGKAASMTTANFEHSNFPIQSILYVNKKTKSVQVAEPFDVKCHRLKANFSEINRAKLGTFNKAYGEASNKNSIKLLQDPYGGFLFHCSRRDAYSASEKISEDMYSNNKVTEEIAKINTYHLSSSLKEEKLQPTVKQPPNPAAALRAKPPSQKAMIEIPDKIRLQAAAARLHLDEAEESDDDSNDEDNVEDQNQNKAPVDSSDRRRMLANRMMMLNKKTETPPIKYNSPPALSPIILGKGGSSNTPVLKTPIGNPDSTTSMKNNAGYAASVMTGITSGSASRKHGDAAALATQGANSSLNKDILEQEKQNAAFNVIKTDESILWRQIKLIKKSKYYDEHLVKQEHHTLASAVAAANTAAHGGIKPDSVEEGPCHRFLKLFDTTPRKRCKARGGLARRLDTSSDDEEDLSDDDDDQEQGLSCSAEDRRKLGFEQGMSEKEFECYYLQIIDLTKDPRNIALLMKLSLFLLELQCNYEALAVCGRILDIITSKEYLGLIYNHTRYHIHHLETGIGAGTANFNETMGTAHNTTTKGSVTYINNSGGTASDTHAHIQHNHKSNNVRFHHMYIETLSLLDLVVCKLAGKFLSNYSYVNNIGNILELTPQNSEVLAHVAKLFHKLKYEEQAEQMYLGALLVDSYNPDALRGYSHLLLEKFGFNSGVDRFVAINSKHDGKVNGNSGKNREGFDQSKDCAVGSDSAAVAANIASRRYHLKLAGRYLGRIPSSAACYHLARTEFAWITEFLGADEDAVKLTYKKVIGNSGNRNRASSYALSSLAHYDHLGCFMTRNGNNDGSWGYGQQYSAMDKVVDLYHRALAYFPNNIHALVLLTCFTSNIPNYYRTDSSSSAAVPLLVGAFSGTTGRRLNNEEVDSYYRRALYFCTPSPSSSSCTTSYVRWIVLLGYAETLICLQQDMQRAEEVLWEATRFSSNYHSIWPAIALVHFYLYVRGNVKKAYKVLNWVYLSKRKALVERILSTRETRRKAYNTMISGNANVFHDISLFQQQSDKGGGNISFVTEDEQRLLEEQVAIYITLAYCELNSVPCNYDQVLSYCNEALALDDANNAIYRCLGIVYWKKSIVLNDVNVITNTISGKLDGAIPKDPLYEQPEGSSKSTSSNAQMKRYKQASITYFNKATKNNNALASVLSAAAGSPNCSVNEALFIGGGNPYTLRQCSIVQALQGNYSQSLQLMVAATVVVDQTNVIAWRVLGVMQYMFGNNDHSTGAAAMAIAEKSLRYLQRALELSDYEDIESIRYYSQICMELQRYKRAHEMILKGLRIIPGDPVLLMNLGVTLSALGYTAPEGMFRISYKEKFESTLLSLDELTVSVDPEEVIEASTYVNLSKLATRNNARQKRRLDLIANKGRTVADNIELLGAMTHDDEGVTRQCGVEDAPPDVLYWAGMYFIKKCTSSVNLKQKYDKSGGLELPQDTDLNILMKAKNLFVRAVQRIDCIPHPLSLHMLGWIEEHYNCYASGEGNTSEPMVNLAVYRQHLAVAERYYVYALQLDPIDPIMFIKLYRQIHDTLCYVRGLTKIAEHNEKELNKKAARAEATSAGLLKKKKKKKLALQNSMELGKSNLLKHSTRNKSMDANELHASEEQAHQLIYEIANVMRQRLLLHERVFKLAQLRAGKLSAHINGLLNNNICEKIESHHEKSSSKDESAKSITMGKFLYVETFWLEKIFHIFSFEGDDWTWLLKSSKSYQNRHHQTNQSHAASK